MPADIKDLNKELTIALAVLSDIRLATMQARNVLEINLYDNQGNIAEIHIDYTGDKIDLIEVAAEPFIGCLKHLSGNSVGFQATDSHLDLLTDRGLVSISRIPRPDKQGRAEFKIGKLVYEGNDKFDPALAQINHVMISDTNPITMAAYISNDAIITLNTMEVAAILAPFPDAKPFMLINCDRRIIKALSNMEPPLKIYDSEAFTTVQSQRLSISLGKILLGDTAKDLWYKALGYAQHVGQFGRAIIPKASLCHSLECAIAAGAEWGEHINIAVTGKECLLFWQGAGSGMLQDVINLPEDTDFSAFAANPKLLKRSLSAFPSNDNIEFHVYNNVLTLKINNYVNAIGAVKAITLPKSVADIVPDPLPPHLNGVTIKFV